jgi:fibronectin-binding autotransporter adhesin
MAGLDRPVSDHLTVGVAGGYSRTHVGAHDGESGDIDTPRLALYASYDLGRAAFDATAGYGYDRLTARRPISSTGETASSAHDGHEATAAMQLRTSLALDGIAVVPRAGLRFAHLSEGSFTESGSPGFDLAVASRDADSLRPFVGASAAKSFTTSGGTVWTPRVDVEWSHETLDAAPAGLVSVGGGSFTVEGLTPSRDEVTVGAGVTAKVGERLALYADYRAVLPTGNLFQQTVSAGLRVIF